MNAVFLSLTPTPLPVGEGQEVRVKRKMNTPINFIEIEDAQLQERVAIVVEDNARTAEQILTEQAEEHKPNENISTPKFLP
jgi:hypothetical protein